MHWIQDEQRAYSLRRHDGPLPHARAITGDFLRPGFRAHMLRPERPRAALGRTRLVHSAALPLEIWTGVGKVLQVKVPVGLQAMLRGELPGTEPEVAGEAAPIIQSQVDVSIGSAGDTAPSRLLALEAYAPRPPGLPAHVSARAAAEIGCNDSLNAAMNASESPGVIAVERT